MTNLNKSHSHIREILDQQRRDACRQSIRFANEILCTQEDPALLKMAMRIKTEQMENLQRLEGQE